MGGARGPRISLLGHGSGLHQRLRPRMPRAYFRSMMGPDAKQRHPVLEKNYNKNKPVEDLWGNRNGMRGNN